MLVTDAPSKLLQLLQLPASLFGGAQGVEAVEYDVDSLCGGSN